jgi:hypothetical protein
MLLGRRSRGLKGGVPRNPPRGWRARDCIPKRDDWRLTPRIFCVRAHGPRAIRLSPYRSLGGGAGGDRVPGPDPRQEDPEAQSIEPSRIFCHCQPTGHLTVAPATAGIGSPALTRVRKTRKSRGEPKLAPFSPPSATSATSDSSAAGKHTKKERDHHFRPAATHTVKAFHHHNYHYHHHHHHHHDHRRHTIPGIIIITAPNPPSHGLPSMPGRGPRWYPTFCTISVSATDHSQRTLDRARPLSISSSSSSSSSPSSSSCKNSSDSLPHKASHRHNRRESGPAVLLEEGVRNGLHGRDADPHALSLIQNDSVLHTRYQAPSAYPSDGDDLVLHTSGSTPIADGPAVLVEEGVRDGLHGRDADPHVLSLINPSKVTRCCIQVGRPQ